jgi:cation diffusion facilitator CzcD-associated flavoprotein CzcO
MTIAPPACSDGTLPALDADVLIVGAGFGGLGMAITVKRAGLRSFLVLERAADVGGTWRDNIYPGCACDIPAMLYSFSFQRRARCTLIYPQQAEILQYLQRTVRNERLERYIRFNSDVTEARYDDARATWTVTLADGSTLRSRVVISAMGPLSKPHLPAVPGRETFAGPSFHSARWEYSVDLRGKNVVVVGTGASAIGFVPHIAPEAAQLTVVARTPPWVIPRNDAPVGPLRRFARAVLPGYAWLVRKAIYWMLEMRALGFVVAPTLLEQRERDVRRFIERSVPDPILRAKVTPAYRAGCKRILISDDYYPALQRPNVELVTAALTEIRPHSVVLADGREIPADVVIYGTGFRATDGIAPVRAYGSGGSNSATPGATAWKRISARPWPDSPTCSL